MLRLGHDGSALSDRARQRRRRRRRPLAGERVSELAGIPREVPQNAALFFREVHGFCQIRSQLLQPLHPLLMCERRHLFWLQRHHKAGFSGRNYQTRQNAQSTSAIY